MANEILKPNLWKLEDVFKEIYNVPVYQRPYSWDTYQVEVLIKDLFDAYGSVDKDEGYYTGNIIIHDKNDKIKGLISKYEIIDGQQRITTFTLILLSLYCILCERNVNIVDETFTLIKSCLWKKVDREYQKDLKAVTLNSLEKKCFEDIYNYAFTNPKNLFQYVTEYKFANKFEERIIDNFRKIHAELNSRLSKKDKNSVLDFADYLLHYVQVIAISTSIKDSKIFNIFESINSKGKELDETDKIKCYIFSQIDESSYETYLKVWGDLITLSNDNLYDYLLIFIKAYMNYYRININVDKFKNLCRTELLVYYKENNLSEALKKLLNDMLSKVEYYTKLFSVSKINALLPSRELKFWYSIFTKIEYKHPRALFLRTFIDYKENKISQEDAEAIIIETIKFMIKYMTISGKDSKDLVTVFSNVMNDVYVRGEINRGIVISSLVDALISKGITQEKLKSDLGEVDAYERDRTLPVAILSLYESTHVEDNKYKISYDQAFTLLNSFSESFSLDHLLVQTPEVDSKEFAYYKNEKTNRLVLKSNHDFPVDIVVDGMDYDLFTSRILNKLGNLRIYYRDKNSGRQNSSIELKDYGTFNKYTDIVKRGKEICDLFIDNILKVPNVNLAKTQTTSLKKSEASLPDMGKLIELGMIKPGEKIYITCKTLENSTATLLDDKYVEFNGKKMTLNEWGCKVTGWKSIRIYAYTALVGEIETLHTKRINYLESLTTE